MKRFKAISFALIILWSCSENEKPNQFSDAVLVSIADFQDRRLTDSLIEFLQSRNPIYRSAASMAFASVQDTAASGVLGNLLLEDPDGMVRRNAAFALGQTGGIAAVNALIPAIQDRDGEVVREALEALGKFYSQPHVRKALIASLNTQKDPLVQIALIRLMVEMKAQGITKELERISTDEETLPAVKDEAHAGILRLS